MHRGSGLQPQGQSTYDDPKDLGPSSWTGLSPGELVTVQAMNKCLSQEGPATLHWYWVPAHGFTLALDLSFLSPQASQPWRQGLQCLPLSLVQPWKKLSTTQRVVGSRWLVAWVPMIAARQSYVGQPSGCWPRDKTWQCGPIFPRVHLNSFSDLGSRISVSGTVPWPYSLDYFTPSETHTESCLVLRLLLYYN